MAKFPLTAAAGFLMLAPLAAQAPVQEVSSSVLGPRLTPELTRIFAGGSPANLAELTAMESYVQAMFQKILPTTVNVGGGTGVVIPGGYILTAGHVTQRAGRTIYVITHDGRRIKTKSLGLSNSTDTGLLQIEGKVQLPAAPMGKSGELKPGAWCMLLGYPGGRKPNRPAPLRLGRVLRVVEPGRGYMVTDCTISAGDSGGPLFDMEGRVIGINSRISRNLMQNMHTPIDAFHQEWKRLVAGEVMGRSRTLRSPRRGNPTTPGWLGIQTDQKAEKAVVSAIEPGSPAAKAGLQVGDVVLKLNRRSIYSGRTLARQVRRLWKGDKVTLRVRRGGEELSLEAVAVHAPQARPKAQPKPKPKAKAGAKNKRKRIL